MNSNDYVKFLTQELLKKIEHPETKEKPFREPWIIRWFGIVGYYFNIGR